jgi:hypothetical protein
VPDLAGLGRLLLFLGLGLVVLGALLLLSDRLPLFNWIGRLPGDFLIRRGNTTIFIPIVTSIVLSVVLSIILSIFLRRQ